MTKKRVRFEKEDPSGWPKEAREAFRSMGALAGTQYHELVDLRRKVAETASELVELMLWLKSKRPPTSDEAREWLGGMAKPLARIAEDYGYDTGFLIKLARAQRQGMMGRRKLLKKRGRSATR